MKKNILFILLISILFACTDTGDKKKAKKVKIITPQKVDSKKQKPVPTKWIAEIESDAIIPVLFLVAGKLEIGDISLHEGATFKKNQLLYRVNSEAYYYDLVAEKEELTRRLFTVIAQIEVAAPNERQKWIDFLKGISDVELIPAFPAINALKEKVIISDNKLDQQYNKIRKMEKEMSHYFMLAPFNGTISSLKTNVGGFVKKGQELCVLFSNQFHLSCKVSSADLEKMNLKKEFIIKTFNGTKSIGKAIFQFSRPNTSKDSVNLQFSLKQLDKRFKVNGYKIQISYD